MHLRRPLAVLAAVPADADRRGDDDRAERHGDEADGDGREQDAALLAVLAREGAGACGGDATRITAFDAKFS